MLLYARATASSLSDSACGHRMTLDNYIFENVCSLYIAVIIRASTLPNVYETMQ